MDGRGARWVALVVLLALGAAACSGGDDDGGEGRAGRHVEESTAAPLDGGRLTVALDGEPGGLDPTKETFTPAGMTYALAVFDPLMTRAADGSIVPYLAESMTADDDHRVWTLQLREGVTFSDGSPLDAAAVVRVFEAHLASELTRPLLRTIESVAPAGPLAVAFRMKQPWVAFPAYLTGQLGLVPGPAMLDDPEGGRHPVGTGPFVAMAGFTPGQPLVLARNPSYWQAGLPHLDELTLRSVPDASDRVGALEDGGADLVVVSEPSGLRALRSVDDVAVADVDEDADVVPTYEVAFNTAVPPFDDVDCRRRVGRAVSHDGPDTAKPDGCDDLSFTYTTGTSEVDQAAAEELGQQLEDDGIDVTIEASPDADLDALLGRFEAVGRLRPGLVDPDQRFGPLDESSVGPVDSIAVNVGRFVSDDLQAAFEAARASAEPDEGAVDDILAREVPVLSLGSRPSTYAFSPGVAGVRRGISAPGGDALVPPSGTLLPVALHRVKSRS